MHEEGPQRVSVRGKKEVVIVTADEFRRMKGDVTGQALVDALAKSPLRDLEFERINFPENVVQWDEAVLHRFRIPGQLRAQFWT